MRTRILTAIFLSAVAPAIAAQTATSPRQSATKDTGNALTLTGCVTPDSANAGHFTLADFTTGTPTFRLAGTDLRRYLGKRVQLVGATVRPKLSIVGGLTPSPNVAAQAGNMDPAEAARANLGAEGNARPGNIAVPELKVKTIKAVDGPCGPEQ
jgi:hypothetical protein